MTDPIVKAVDDPMQPTAFDIKPFVKPKKGQRLQFETYIVAVEGENFHQKKAHLQLNLPGWRPWEINCDEGTGGTGLGTESAPSPLGYLSAGVAFCLMTHLKGLARMGNIEFSDLRIEQRIKFSSTIDFSGSKPEDVYGRNDGIETYVIVNTKSDSEKLPEFIQHAENACLAHQTLLQQVPAKLTLMVDGEHHKIKEEVHHDEQ